MVSLLVFFGTYLMDSSTMVFQFKLAPFLILFLITLVLMPIQTTTEELIFRGYLMQGFALLAKNRWFPLVMTSVIFGSMHIANPEVEKKHSDSSKARYVETTDQNIPPFACAQLAFVINQHYPSC